MHSWILYICPILLFYFYSKFDFNEKSFEFKIPLKVIQFKSIDPLIFTNLGAKIFKQ